ncbi:MAG: barstar family protein [Planctomycetaceae bacterium]|nr:barstar family protein [Planctomycetaceae bacterium]
MKRVQVDASRIEDWDTFHDVFAETFGFPEFYGRNMNAWIDCMTYLESPGDEMTSVTCDKEDFIIIELLNARGFKASCPEQYEALLECSAFVNWRNLEIGNNPHLMLSIED